MIDFIMEFPDSLSRETCQKIISLYEADPRKGKGNTFTGYRPEVKSCTDLPVTGDIWQELDKELFKAFSFSFGEFRRKHPCLTYATEGGDPIQDTGYLIQRYLPDKDEFFAWHVDNGTFTTCNRLLAGILYLNDVEEGGETEFDIGNGETILIKPEAGKVLWFPPHFMFPHRGLKPKSNPKYIVTTFMIFALPQAQQQVQMSGNQIPPMIFPEGTVESPSE